MKVRIGQFKKVNNRYRKHNQNEFYYSGWINVDGKNVAVLFTQEQIDSGKYRAKNNQEDILERSLISKLID